jgi:hypothetical protein
MRNDSRRDWDRAMADGRKMWNSSKLTSKPRPAL